MKILSIDYDYFQKVSVDTLIRYYPDGVDLPTSITEITWADHYVNPYSAKPLEQVKVNREELDLMKEILLNQRADLPVMIANSHVHIYDFIHEHCKTGQKLSVVNVDMHHDMFNSNDKVDCGNWVYHIVKDYGKENTNIEWVMNPVSSDAYGLSKFDSFFSNLPTSVSHLTNKRFDLVFLCRSDTWTPPHLDKGFDELVDTIKSHFEIIKIEQSITRPRNLEPLIEQLKPQYEEYAKILNQKNRHKGSQNIEH